MERSSESNPDCSILGERSDPTGLRAKAEAEHVVAKLCLPMVLGCVVVCGWVMS